MMAEEKKTMNPSEIIPEQQVPVLGEYDVVVCGAGPAGIGAAVASARGGARTLLIERLSHVGGVATGAGITKWADTQGGPVFDELVQRMEAVDAAKWFWDPANHLHKPGRVRFHAETLKAVALKMIKNAGIDVLFCTIAEGAWCPVPETVGGVFLANKGGRSLAKARTVIDASADGDIAASAGAEFLKGDP